MVSVSGEQWIGETSTEPGRRLAIFSIEVVNTGNQATQVVTAYWQTELAFGPWQPSQIALEARRVREERA